MKRCCFGSHKCLQCLGSSQHNRAGAETASLEAAASLSLLCWQNSQRDARCEDGIARPESADLSGPAVAKREITVNCCIMMLFYLFLRQ